MLATKPLVQLPNELLTELKQAIIDLDLKYQVSILREGKYDQL